ncbi:ribosome silencing factor [Rhodoferax lacus]|uniref:Ribosomal silencing factor RsfS n=1 Tax=Rhodoferax lacus TaxID=2184758 RepID=A0A3E1RH44_9BURK|nr:ribosome silencing factor [Rhodoferax lacus]RFO98679.1 ribosome silencing factor [Rhodoferax lacus]
MTTPTVVKKDTQKLQRAIVDGLEDVKAQDIVVFDTEHLSALFERVIIASGTSNRQTKALAASVRDAVREAGFPKPRVEGETNGEWIIVDCGQAVVHIMQPNFRQYYHLEELWGEKPVRLKLGSAKPAAPEKEVAVVTKGVPPATLKRSSAAKKGVAEVFPSKAQVKKNEAVKAAAVKKAAVKSAPAKSAAAKSTSTRGPVAPAKKVAAKSPAAKAPAVKVAAKTLVVKAPAKTVARVAAKKAEVRKPAAKKTVSKG